MFAKTTEGQRNYVVKAILAVSISCVIPTTHAANAARMQLDYESLTVDEIRLAMLEDGMTCVQVIAGHMQRIQNLDGALNSVIGLNPAALEQAAAIDSMSRNDQRKLPLLCVPTLIKDNIDVAGISTTAGSKVFEKNIATKDADTVALLRRAGAVVVAKTNMSEFAFNYKGASAMGGRTRNPYDTRLSAGGSSSGNAAALAAGFGIVALGTDTSGSIRVPAAVTGLIGLRPSLEKVSTVGVLALSPGQDVVGPMCRSAEDCVKVFGVLTKENQNLKPTSSGDVWKRLRIGVVRGLFPQDVDSIRFMASVEEALKLMQANGAVIENVTLADEQVLVGNAAPQGETAKFMSRSAFDFPAVINAYLPSRNLEIKSYAEFQSALKSMNEAKKEGDKVIDDVNLFGINYSKRDSDARYRVNGAFRDEYVLARLGKVFEGGNTEGATARRYDFLIYPSVQGFNDTAANGPNTGGTHRLSAYSGYPAIAFPVGWARRKDEGRLEPVGIELLALPNEEYRLLDIAAAWAKLSPFRPTPRFSLN